jgi:hypothetical protein
MLHHGSVVYHLLEVLKGVHHQLILDRINQSILEVILLLFVICHICRGVTGQLNEVVPILTHRQRSLLQCKELLLLMLHQTLGYVLLSELVLEFLPVDGVGVS